MAKKFERTSECRVLLKESVAMTFKNALADSFPAFQHAASLQVWTQ